MLQLALALALQRQLGGAGQHPHICASDVAPMQPHCVSAMSLLALHPQWWCFVVGSGQAQNRSIFSYNNEFHMEFSATGCDGHVRLLKRMTSTKDEAYLRRTGLSRAFHLAS